VHSTAQSYEDHNRAIHIKYQHVNSQQYPCTAPKHRNQGRTWSTTQLPQRKKENNKQRDKSRTEEKKTFLYSLNTLFHFQDNSILLRSG
jgi:hypothetical protein